MTDQIRWGILATGGIAARFARELALVPDAELVAVGRARRRSRRPSPPSTASRAAHGSWEALAADPDVDVIYVATPHSHHHAAASLCLQAGKPLLVEKAFTLDLAQAAGPRDDRPGTPAVPDGGDVDAHAARDPAASRS